jgi:excisionase family DNA binding protein
MKQGDRLLTTREAMEYLRVSRVTLYKIMKRKELPSHRVGFHYRFRQSELDRYLNKR